MTTGVPNPPGEVTWLRGYGSGPVVGSCRHGCQHNQRSAVAWGPSYERYELVVCVVPRPGCASGCRAWVNGRGKITTAWLEIRRSES